MPNKLLTSIKILGITFAIVLSAELLLRLTGQYILPQETDYGDLSQDKDKIRILTLGESTTDERYAQGKAWTNQLEALLINKGHDVRIYNVARVGTNSALLMSRLPDQLELYRPHIVMTMMGINDTESMVYNFSEPTFKLQKLYQIVSERIDSRLSCELEEVHPLSASPENIARWLNLTKKENLQELEKQIRKKVKTDQEVASTLTAISEVIKNRFFPYDETEFMHLLNRAHELHPRNDHTLRVLLHVLNGKKHPRCLELSKELLPCGVNLSDEFLQLISNCYRTNKKELAHETYRIRGLSLMSGTGFTAKHYQQLADLLKKKKISLVAMQYPTLSLENLKLNFKDQKEIVFITNEENFKQALARYPFQEIFLDNFRATWGHTTKLGHEIIAKSAMKEIEPLVQKLKSPKR
jgi:lysophospholipase L1-like esterase